jgi:3-oxoacyl-[acyl-carrier protein] reductase
MNILLTGKVALITGGARGIGWVTAEMMAQLGAVVVVGDLNKPDKIQSSVTFKKLDVRDSASCESLYNEIIKEHGQIDILVNNAGLARDAMTRKMTASQWHETLDVNLTGAFNITRLVGPQMVTKGSGSIINLSSVVGVQGNVGQANYAATKAGLIGLTKSWAKEFALNGAHVRVNAVAPGFVETEMLSAIPTKYLDALRKKTLFGRLGRPEEIANVIVFLASEAASYITGQVINVNGGMTL